MGVDSGGLGKWRERHTWLPMGNISTRQRLFSQLDSDHRQSCLGGDCLFWACLYSARICGLDVSQKRSENRGLKAGFERWATKFEK